MKQLQPNISVPKGFKRRHIETLNGVFSYFKIEKAIFFVEKEHFVNQLPNTELVDLNGLGFQDLIYVSESYLSDETINKAFSNLKRTGVLIIEKPYSNPFFWDVLKSNSSSKVVVDTYFFGFVFPRKIQAKEMFFIRL